MADRGISDFSADASTATPAPAPLPVTAPSKTADYIKAGMWIAGAAVFVYLARGLMRKGRR
jgi:hypothetical protein